MMLQGMESLLIASSLMIVGFLIFHKIRRRKLEKLAEHFPGPRTLPLFGNALMFLGKDMYGCFEIIRDVARNSNSGFRIWFGQDLHVYLTDPKDVENVMTNPNAIEKDHVYDYFRMVADGIFSSRGKRWWKNRKLVNPAFGTKQLEHYVATFNKHSNIFAERVRDHCGETINVLNLINAVTIDVLCESVLGIEIGAQSGKASKFVQSIGVCLDIVFKRIFNIHFHSDIVFKLSPESKIFNEHVKYLHSFTSQIISKAKAERQKMKERDRKNGEVKAPPTNFMEKFLTIQEEGGELTDYDILHEVLTIIISGFDTSAMTASAVMLMLAMYPEIQEKARREAEEILSGNSASLEDINRLVYLEAVTKETLRLFGPPLFLRKIKGDVPLENCTLVEGCTTVVFVYDIHKNPKFWDSPEEFMPERFIGNSLKHRYCYLPFSSGPRNCPGQRFANVSMKLILANLLRHYKLSTHITDWSQIKMKLDVLQKPVDGYPLKIEPLR
uniref:Cytochrome P450 n=1 Tax=Laodelphax striatellus TaxID=195883 RepID=K4JQ90_LAOST|nr:cytochrome P450 CYP426A1 [Laodelphax striatellus]AGN52799.1 cytochrome P450 [Laodelphax striatellus]